MVITCPAMTVGTVIRLCNYMRRPPLPWGPFFWILEDEIENTETPGQTNKTYRLCRLHQICLDIHITSHKTLGRLRTAYCVLKMSSLVPAGRLV